MIYRKGVKRPDYVYPADPWRLVEKRFYPRLLPQTETFFATANGYMGMRGSFEEGRPTFDGGTFVNGFYESWPIIYGEEAFGFAETGQTIVEVPDAKIMRLHVDDEPLYLPTADLVGFERVLDMKSGTLDRQFIWETQSGKRVRVESKRLVSLQHRHLAAISYEVTVQNAEAPVVISSQIVTRQNGVGNEGDPRRSRGFQHRVLATEDTRVRDRRIVLGHKTSNSGMTIASGVDHVIETECPHSVDSAYDDDVGKVVFSADAKPGVPIRIVKYITYHTSRSAPPAELCDRAERTLDRALQHGFTDLLDGQREYLDGFWQASDVEVRVMERLGLEAFPVATQTYPRKQDWLVLNALAGLAGSLYKFAFDLRILQSPPIGELGEPFGKLQVGSSAMPFKRNPIDAEKIDSLARMLAQYPRLGWDNAAHTLLERTLDDSANRRTSLPETFLITDELLLVTKKICEGLRVDEAAMKRNFATYGPFAASERVLMTLGKAGADRQIMHEKIRELTMQAWETLSSGEPNPLIELIANEPSFLHFLDTNELRTLMDASGYIGDAPSRAKALTKQIQEILDA